MPRRPRPTASPSPAPASSSAPPESTDWLGERLEPAQDADPQDPALSDRRESTRAKGIGQAVESRRGSHR